MHTSITRVVVAVAAAAALSTLGSTEADASGVADPAAQSVEGPSAGASVAACPGARVWVKRYNGPANGGDSANSVAVSPAGGRVFVTGSSDGGASYSDYLTVAYSTATGARLWARRYNGPTNGTDAAFSMAVSRAGDRVFVAGSSEGGTSDSSDYATVAYDAATGARLWARRYNGPAKGSDSANSVAVSPGGDRVFVTGSTWGATSRYDYLTVAYGAAAGARLWARRYNGPANREDFAHSVAVSPGGDRVFVAGSSEGGTSHSDYLTVAYRG